MTGKDSDMGMKFYLATEGCEHSPYHCTFHYPVTSFYFDLFTLIIQTPTSTPVDFIGVAQYSWTLKFPACTLMTATGSNQAQDSLSKVHPMKTPINQRLNIYNFKSNLVSYKRRGIYVLSFRFYGISA